jgi:regulatory factor X
MDPSASGFNTDSYNSMSYMDTSNVQTESDAGLHQPSLSFPDFSASTPYDVANAFTPQDLSLTSGSTPAASSETESDATEPIKSETPATT